MHFSKVTLAALAASSACGSPIAARSSDPIISADVVVDTSLSLATRSALEARLPPLTFRTFAHGTVVTLAAAVAVGDTLWTALIESCQQATAGGTGIASTGVQCAYRAIEVTFKFALYWQVFNKGNFEAIKNHFTGETKRDMTSHIGWHQHWQSLSSAKQADTRALLPPTPGFWMHSIADGVPDIPGSACFHYARDNDNSIAVRHVTNGTHGYVHVGGPPTDDDGSNDKRAVLNENFSFSHKIAGLKFSYIHPCSKKNLGTITEDDLEVITNDFVQSFLQGGQDKYAIEMDIPGQGPVVYGNLIVEGSGFGKNYEGLNFSPPHRCRDEL